MFWPKNSPTGTIIWKCREATLPKHTLTSAPKRKWKKFRSPQHVSHQMNVLIPKKLNKLTFGALISLLKSTTNPPWIWSIRTGSHTFAVYLLIHCSYSFWIHSRIRYMQTMLLYFFHLFLDKQWVSTSSVSRTLGCGILWSVLTSTIINCWGPSRELELYDVICQRYTEWTQHKFWEIVSKLQEPFWEKISSTKKKDLNIFFSLLFQLKKPLSTVSIPGSQTALNVNTCTANMDKKSEGMGDKSQKSG